MTSATHSDRLERLLGYVEADPANLNLLADTAAAAFEAQDFALTGSLIARCGALAPLPPALAKLDGLVALAQGQFADAAAVFERLREDNDSPALRFDLAWTKAMMGAYQEALALLDDETVQVSPRAPALKIHAMHHLALYEDALACGQVLAQRFPDNEELMGALATLALDADKSDLALHYAERAGANAEGRAALGLLALGGHDTKHSLELFAQALAVEPANPRAWVGKGLGLLASGDAVGGAAAIDRGTALFDSHIGSWIASGWAHFVGGDVARARASFERALAIDPNFSESHGGLAVLDILDGNLAQGRRSCEIALRLDRNCFGGALAKSLLLERSGHARAGQAVLEIALSTPIGPSGRTIAQEVVAFGLRPPPRIRNGAIRKPPG